MIVYVIISGDYWEADFDRVFSTLEKALAYQKEFLKPPPVNPRYQESVPDPDKKCFIAEVEVDSDKLYKIVA